MKKNKLIIAAAGSGKTTFIVKEALKQKEGKTLITTYTEAKEEEIRKKIIKLNKCIPENITVQTWFSLLLQHGIRPYQGCLFDKDINGLILVNSQSAVKYTNPRGIPICYSEEIDLEKHYFTDNQKIYSDKLSKFVIKCNQKCEGAIITRLSRIYSHIFIDEVQDLAGYDLEFIKLLFSSTSNIILVGDPRQVTYLTHNEKKYSKYTGGLIKNFVLKECKKDICSIDECSLNVSHRNNKFICDFSARLYPDLQICESRQNKKTPHDGIFLVKKKDVKDYLQKYTPMQLRNDRSVPVDENYEVKNFGESKGLGFDRVLIYPTKGIIQFLKDGMLYKKVKDKKTGEIIVESKPAFDIAKFYVAITRAKFSVGIVCDYDNETYIDGVNKFSINEEITEVSRGVKG